MTANDLVLMLRDPQFLQRQDQVSLEKLVKTYPYFFIAYALLAKKNFEDPKRPKQVLHKAALQSADREMLYHFMQERLSGENSFDKINEEVTAPFKQKEWVLPELENEELIEMLRSIHENKQAFLQSGNSAGADDELDSTNSEVDEGEKDASNQYELDQMSIADAEFAMKNISMEEEDLEKDETPSLEISSNNKLESEMREHTKFESPGDLLMMNESSAATAEFIPTEFLNSEDENEEFALEHDSEVDSIRVIEEEFILRDLDFDLQKEEIEVISEVESPLQAEAENLIVLDAPEDMHLIEMQEEETEGLTERDEEDDSSLRINEYVQSPGEFLPEKSYTFSQWLKFFKYDKLAKNAVPQKTPEQTESPKIPTEERSFGTTMQQELESIDRIVSSLKYEPLIKPKEISAEELAKKSLELNDEVVSETLAKIYEEQGKYAKAIRQYVKLSLIYPEKVSFFAARIKELKSKR